MYWLDFYLRRRTAAAVQTATQNGSRQASAFSFQLSSRAFDDISGRNDANLRYKYLVFYHVNHVQIVQKGNRNFIKKKNFPQNHENG